MFRVIKRVDILGEKIKLPVVLERMLVGTTGLTHSRKNQLRGYTPFYSQLNQKLIPLQFSEFFSVNFRLYTLSTGPIVTTTYINTKED